MDVAAWHGESLRDHAGRRLACGGACAQPNADGVGADIDIGRQDMHRKRIRLSPSGAVAPVWTPRPRVVRAIITVSKRAGTVVLATLCWSGSGILPVPANALTSTKHTVGSF